MLSSCGYKEVNIHHQTTIGKTDTVTVDDTIITTKDYLNNK